MVTRHDPRRPSWHCAGCDDPWPCAPARLALVSAYRGYLSGLTATMAGHYLDAVADLRPDSTDGLYSRFVGWARRALFADADQRQRSQKF